MASEPFTSRIQIVGDQITFDGVPVANLILSGSHGLPTPDVTRFVMALRNDPVRAFEDGYAEGYAEGSRECCCN